MRISREADYAIRCIFHMAREPEKLHLIVDIAKSQEVPKSFLAKILQKLAKAGIVSSTRGVNGGFSLSRRPADITLLDVIEAVQGPLSLNACIIDHKICARKEACSVHPVWKEIREFLGEKLREYSFTRILGTGNSPAGMVRRDSSASRSEGCVFCHTDTSQAGAAGEKTDAEEGNRRVP
ncbi:MAG: Rrf2 family transcriptional regulator [Alphaproteobacteria bacterium]|uniref:Rrf2 family transcriptional regulator n=1 Tax=Candidatus Nitrobium versatile TaxID=2884831 RepID=A0A953M0S3_9BACT|nr:Rrf2 family transcriptional regulator [Candidatus Nitrobium versatile]